MAELSLSIGATTGTRTGTDANVGAIVTNFLNQHYADDETVDLDTLTAQEKADLAIDKLIEFIMGGHHAWLRSEAESTAGDDAVEGGEPWE